MNGDDKESLAVLIAQVVGFVGAILLVILHYAWFPSIPFWAPLAAMAIHFIGDIVFIAENGLGNSTGFDINDYVVLYPFIGWVGLGVMLLSFMLGHDGHQAHKWFFGIGFMLSATGNYGSYRIYKDGQDPAAHEPPKA
jgi:hypothetical protein